VKDINGHPNIIGDGINVAQRIMSFARPGQIVVSRSYYDVVSNLASEYAKLFSYEGSRTDKHVREHEIYVIGHHEGALKKAKDSMKDRAASTATNVRRVSSATSPPGSATVTLTIPSFARDKKTLTMIALGLAAVVAVLGVLVILKKSDSSPPSTVAALPVPAAKAPVPEPPKAEPAPAPATAAAQPAAPEAAKADPGKTEAPKADASKSAPSAGTTSTTAKPDAGKADAAKAAAAAKPSTDTTSGGVPPAALVFAIQPWGEVFVNGKSIGVSPPVKSHKLPPGKYRIEVRNTTFAVHAETLDLKARDEVTIRHRFQ
jgi:hypothetical protein